MKLLANVFKTPAAVVFYGSFLLGVVLFLETDGELGNLLQLELRVPALFSDSWLSERDGIWVVNNLSDELLTLVILLSGLVLGFSKEKAEDEYTALLRGAALQWSLVANTVLAILATFSIYGIAYFNFMVIQLFSILLLFNLRFQYTLYKHGFRA